MFVGLVLRRDSEGYLSVPKKATRTKEMSLRVRGETLSCDRDFGTHTLRSEVSAFDSHATITDKTSPKEWGVSKEYSPLRKETLDRRLVTRSGFNPSVLV